MLKVAPKAWHAPVALLLLFVGVVCFAQYAGQFSNDPFDEFVKKYNKRYSIAEYHRRKEIFWQNIAFIRAHDPSSFEVKVNQFADLTRFEFERTHLGLRQTTSPFRNAPLLGAHKVTTKEDDLPESVDWLAAGKVSPVENQGMCGACYTFSAANAIESAIAIRDGTAPLQLSNQQILDCSDQRGCIGGTMDESFEYVAKFGLCEYQHYPYRGFEGICRTGCKKVIPPGYVTGFIATDQDDVSLMSAVMKQPVSVGIDADGLFQFYSGGVFTQPCGSALNHGVLVVGYGIRKKQKYWLVKNSWGKHWGMDGYVLIERGNTKLGPGGKCGILKFGSYPVLDPAKGPQKSEEPPAHTKTDEEPEIDSMMNRTQNEVPTNRTPSSQDEQKQKRGQEKEREHPKSKQEEETTRNKKRETKTRRRRTTTTTSTTSTSTNTSAEPKPEQEQEQEHGFLAPSETQIPMDPAPHRPLFVLINDVLEQEAMARRKQAEEHKEAFLLQE